MKWVDAVGAVFSRELDVAVFHVIDRAENAPARGDHLHSRFDLIGLPQEK